MSDTPRLRIAEAPRPGEEKSLGKALDEIAATVARLNMRIPAGEAVTAALAIHPEDVPRLKEMLRTVAAAVPMRTSCDLETEAAFLGLPLEIDPLQKRGEIQPLTAEELSARRKARSPLSFLNVRPVFPSEPWPGRDLYRSPFYDKSLFGYLFSDGAC